MNTIEMAYDIADKIEGVLGKSVPTNGEPYFKETKELAILFIDEMINKIDNVCGTTWKDEKDRTRSFTYEGKVRLVKEINILKEVKSEIERLPV